MKPQRTVLLIEDEEAVANAIAEGLKRSQLYEFDVTSVLSLDGCLRGGILSRRFDLSVIDLKLTQGDKFFGLSAVRILTFDHVGGMTVVYSAFPRTENVVRAMQLGAIDFISKTTCAPHQLVGKLELILSDQDRAAEREKQMSDLIAARHGEWKQKYAGKVLAIEAGEVVSVGDTRLEAVIRHHQELTQHPEWSTEPYLLEIDSAEE